MKTVILLAIIALLLLPALVHAQDPTAEPTPSTGSGHSAEATAVPDVSIAPDPVVDPPLPVEVEPTEPAESAVNSVVLIVGAFAVLATNILVTAIKSIPYLANEDKDKLAVAVTQIVAVAVGVATGYLTSLIAQSLGLIADDSIRNMVIAILTPVLSELRYRLEKLTAKPTILAPVDFPVHTM